MDPNIFYHRRENELWEYNILTQTSSLLRAFTEYAEIDFCGGTTDVSEDGDHIAICGDDNTVFAYELSTDTTFATKTFGEVCGAQMTPNNNVIVDSSAVAGGCGQGPWELYDINMNFTREIISFAGHMDIGRDLNGDEIMVIIASTDPSPASGCEGNGIEKIRLSDSQKTCLLPLYWGEGSHMGISDNGWVIVSNVDASTRGTARPPGSLPSDWQHQWGVYFNELTLVKLDGSETRRLAHHRSRRCEPGCRARV